jgi:hypothetical protein
MMLQEGSGRRQIPRDSEMFRQEDPKSRDCFSSKSIPYSNISNRHEKLFCCGRQGKLFAKTTLQMFYLLTILYFSMYIVYNAEQAYTKYKEATMGNKVEFLTFVIASALCPVFMLLIWILAIPQILSKFTIITNVNT